VSVSAAPSHGIQAMIASSVQAWGGNRAYYVDQEERVIKRLPWQSYTVGIGIDRLPWGFDGDCSIKFKRRVGKYYISEDNEVYNYTPGGLPGEDTMTSAGFTIDMIDYAEYGACWVALDTDGAVWIQHDYTDDLYPSAYTSSPVKIVESGASAIGVIYCQDFVEGGNGTVRCFDSEGNDFLFEDAPVLEATPTYKWDDIPFPCWRIDGDIIVHNCRSGDDAASKTFAENAKCVQHFGLRGVTAGPEIKDGEDKFLESVSRINTLFESYIVYGDGEPKFSGLAGAPYSGVEHVPYSNMLATTLEEWGGLGCNDSDTEIIRYSDGETEDKFLNVDFFDYETVLANATLNDSAIPRSIMSDGEARGGAAVTVVEEEGPFDDGLRTTRYTITAKAFEHDATDLFAGSTGDDQYGPAGELYTPAIGSITRCGFIVPASISSYSAPSVIIGPNDITTVELNESCTAPDVNTIDDSGGVYYSDSDESNATVFCREDGIYMISETSNTLEKLQLKKDDGTLIDFKKNIRSALKDIGIYPIVFVA